jgi:hypothetical protein
VACDVVKRYRYVGPREIAVRAAAGDALGFRPASARGLRDWLRQTAQAPDGDGLFPVTFVVDAEGSLRVADRRSEHVACAGGRPVQSAGELFLLAGPGGVRVERATDQSTGYCPEPESWPAVAVALDRLGVPHPARFTEAFTFRRCPACGQRNVVKDGWFACGVCGADLPATWNAGEAEWGSGG